MFLKKEIAQCKRIFREIDKPENQRAGMAMLATAGLEEMLKDAQRRMFILTFVFAHLCGIAGFVVGWFVFGRI